MTRSLTSLIVFSIATATAHTALLPTLAAAAPLRTKQTKILLQKGNHQGLGPGKAVWDGRRRCYYVVSHGGDTEILRFDPKTRLVRRVFARKKRVVDLLYDRQRDRLFVATSYKDIYVLDPGKKFRVQHKWKGGGRPESLAFDPKTKRLYVANSGYGGRDAKSRVVMAFRLGTRRPVRIRRLPFAPKHLALDAKRGRLYVASYNRSIGRMYGTRRKGPAGYLAVLSTRRLRVLRTHKLKINPLRMVYDPSAQRLIFRPRWRRTRLVSMALPGGRLTSLSIPALRRGFELSGGTFEPRDRTVRWLLQRRRDFLVVKLAWHKPTQTYRVLRRRRLASISTRRGVLSGGPKASQFLLAVTRSRTLILADLRAKGLTQTRTGYRIDRLAVNHKLHLLYAVDSQAGLAVILDTRTGKVLSQAPVPMSAERLMVSEPLGLVIVVANHRQPGRHRGAKVTKLVAVYDARLKKRRLAVTFKTTIARYARVQSHAIDVRGRMLYMVCDQHVQAISLRTGAFRQFKPPFRDARGVLYDARRKQLLVAGRIKPLALYDARTLRLRKRQNIDPKLCLYPKPARRIGGFDSCRVIFRLWSKHSVWRFYRKLVPPAYPDDYLVDQKKSQVLVIDNPASRNTLDFYAVTLARFRLAWHKRLRMIVGQGRRRGKRVTVDNKTVYRFDATNRVVLFTTRGAFKHKITPRDFRRTWNYAFAFGVDDKRRSLKLRSVAALRDNPGQLVLAPRSRHAFVSHVGASYLTMLTY